MPHTQTSEESDINIDRYLSRNRTVSLAPTPKPIIEKHESKFRGQRRGSHDEKTSKPRKFLIDVEQTCQTILEQEDTDGDFQITVEDSGPKVLKVGTANSQGYNKFDIRGTYMLSNLLQELALAKETGKKHIVISENRLNENPVNRLSRIIRNHFWKGLTRKIDKEGLQVICADPKNRSKNKEPRIYVPYYHNEAYLYYQKLSELNPELNLIVERLPEVITPEYVKSIDTKPGILALKLVKERDEPLLNYRGVPFVVPGGRFNEMYGWDSYFESLGLIEDGKVLLAKAMADNFVYQIKHYGKILNANRSYYLTRSQPPFLTDMGLQIYAKMPLHDESIKEWLSEIMRAAIKEYHTVWMAEPRYDERSGLSTYHTTGVGMPPETEATHFNHLIEPYANKLNISIQEYMDKYNEREITEPELDAYFVHDRAVRESGHDTTYRLERKCADLATIDLNFLLYKYELDIAKTIKTIFNDQLDMIPEQEKHRISRHTGTLFFKGMNPIETSGVWFERAKKRQELIEKYMWDEDKGFYFDYNIAEQKRESYESVTVLWGLWSECVPKHKAGRVAKLALKKFEVTGGLVCGTEISRGELGLDKPNRQWDYPFGWAPHQMLAWDGLHKYGMVDDAQRVAYRWLFTITKSFVDFNGVVPEKFDIVSMTHKVKVEYGNVGTDFKYVPREGFGWMNASYQTGLTYLNLNMKRALGALIPPDTLFKNNIPVYSESEDASEYSPKLTTATQRSRSRSALPQSSQLLKVFMELTTNETDKNHKEELQEKHSPKYITILENGDVKTVPK